MWEVHLTTVTKTEGNIALTDWKPEIESGGIGGGAPTIVDGMMYVGSGYAILSGAPGNVLLAFGLDN